MPQKVIQMADKAFIGSIGSSTYSWQIKGWQRSCHYRKILESRDMLYFSSYV